jgi:hypothetical protein
MAVGYKIYLHTNTDQPEHEINQKNMFMTRKNITYKAEHRLYDDDDDNDVYLEYYSAKGFHINYSVYMSYVKHVNSSNKA